MKDLWLAYGGLGWTSIAAGHQKQPYSLSLEMRSNDIPFIERSIDNFLVEPFVDRALGIRAQSSGDHWFFAGGGLRRSGQTEQRRRRRLGPRRSVHLHTAPG